MLLKRSAAPHIIYFSPHFKPSDLFCKCGVCVEQHINLDLIIKLQKLRDLVRQPIHCNEGFRCPTWNLKVGGAKDSRHLTGMAADIYVVGRSGLDLARAALQVGFRRLGVASHWCHVDVDEPNNGLSTWTYGNINERTVREKLLADLAV